MSPIDQIKSQLRLSVALRDRLLSAATLNGRSMNAEITRRLEDSFETFESKMLSTRLEELATLEEAVLSHQNELDLISNLDPPADVLKETKRKLELATALRDVVRKDVRLLRSLRTV